MSTSRDGPNPLRPYYVPPSVGLPPIHAGGNGSTPRPSAKPASTSSKPGYSSSARDMLSDLDYSDYLSDASPSVAEMIKGLVDQGLWKYTSVLMSQPFEVAKTVLQVQDGAEVEAAGQSRNRLGSKENYGSGRYDMPSDDDSDTDSQSYFTSSAPASQPIRQPRRRYDSSRSPSPATSRSSRRGRSPPAVSITHKHNLHSASSVTAALSTLWTHEGAWGVWKGTNSTFIHGVLLSTFTTFVRSLLCAVLALPDPGIAAIPTNTLPNPAALVGLDIVSSPAPLIALCAAVSASGIAGIILAPLDIARTKLMLTPSTCPPRSIIPAVRALGSWLVPSSLALPTLLYSTLPTFIGASTPLFLRSNLGIDPILTPTTYAVATFTSQLFELGVRLPIETVLRRGQMAVARTPPPRTSRAVAPREDPLPTIVDVGAYKGFVGTMYHIVFEEGTKTETGAEQTLSRATGTATTVRPQQGGRKRKGQGLEGLFRGWRVGVWGLVGCWGASTLGGGGKGGEF